MADLIGSTRIKVYLDTGSKHAVPTSMVDVTGWHRSSIRKGVFDGSWFESQEFQEWKKGCTGRVVIQRDEKEVVGGNATLISPWYVYLETTEDLCYYLLVFDENTLPEQVDAAAFYAPYIPLTFSGIPIPGMADTDDQPARLVTRYDRTTTEDD